MNKKIFVLALSAVSLLCGCGASSTDSPVGASESSSASSWYISVSLDSETEDQYETMRKKIAASKPNIVKTKTKYIYCQEGYDVELSAASELRVEYGDVVKAQYTLTKEVLNDSLDGDFKKTVTSTFYIYGDSFGSLREDGTVDWENATSSGLMLLQFDLNPNYFDQDTVSFADGFHGAVQSGAEELFFGSKDLGGSISSFVINIVTNAAQVTSVSASFKTEKGASVSSSCSFIYVPVSVDIPF